MDVSEALLCAGHTEQEVERCPLHTTSPCGGLTGAVETDPLHPSIQL